MSTQMGVDVWCALVETSRNLHISSIFGRNITIHENRSLVFILMFYLFSLYDSDGDSK